MARSAHNGWHLVYEFRFSCVDSPKPRRATTPLVCTKCDHVKDWAVCYTPGCKWGKSVRRWPVFLNPWHSYGSGNCSTDHWQTFVSDALCRLNTQSTRPATHVTQLRLRSGTTRLFSDIFDTESRVSEFVRLFPTSNINQITVSKTINGQPIRTLSTGLFIWNTLHIQNAFYLHFFLRNIYIYITVACNCKIHPCQVFCLFIPAGSSAGLIRQ